MNNTNINTDSIMNEEAIKEKYLRGNKAKLQTAKVATVLMIIAALLFSWIAYGGPFDATVTSKGSWVYDKDGILNDSTINTINAKNSALYNQTGAEVVVVLEKDSAANIDLIGRAEKLFKDYKVSDSGILFIVSVPTTDGTSKSGVIGEIIGSIKEAVSEITGNDRYSYAYRIGRNVDYSLDEKIDGIFDSNFNSAYNSGNYNAAVLDTFNAFGEYFGDYYNIDLSSSGSIYNYNVTHSATTQINPTVSSAGVRVSYMFTIFAILILAVVLVGRLSRRSYRTPRRVYMRPSWFNFGLGWGMGRHFHNHNYHRHNHHSNIWGPGAHKPHNSRKPNNWGNSFFGGSSGGRSGGGFTGGSSGRNTSNRSGGGFGNSRSGGGSFRGGSGGSRGGGGGSRGGGGGRRR